MGSISSVSHNRDVFVDKLFSFCLNQIMEQQSVRCGRKLPIRRRVWTEKNGARINGHDQNNFTLLPSVLQLLYFWAFPYGNLLIKSQIQVGSWCNSIFFCIWQLHTYTMSKSSGVLRGHSSSLHSHPRWPICRVSLSSSSSLMCQLQFGFRSRDCRRGSPKNKVTARQIVTTCNYLGCVVVSDLAKNAICSKMYYHLSLIPQNWYYLVGSFLKENPLVIGCKKGKKIPIPKLWIIGYGWDCPLFSCHIDLTHLTMFKKGTNI